MSAKETFFSKYTICIHGRAGSGKAADFARLHPSPAVSWVRPAAITVTTTDSAIIPEETHHFEPCQSPMFSAVFSARPRHNSELRNAGWHRPSFWILPFPIAAFEQREPRPRLN